jgi:predicted  nucleic acid-binding Zn-ribbon protein
MNTASLVLLVASNLVLAAAVSYHVLKSPPAPAAHGLSSVETLDASVNRLTLTVQRFNTTSLQFEYLQKEIDRLGLLDQSLSKRIALEESKASDAETNAEDGIKQLQTIQQQVRQELKQHRESIVRLVEGLERQLDSIALATKALDITPAEPTQSSESDEPPVADKLPE